MFVGLSRGAHLKCYTSLVKIRLSSAKKRHVSWRTVLQPFSAPTHRAAQKEL